MRPIVIGTPGGKSHNLIPSVSRTERFENKQKPEERTFASPRFLILVSLACTSLAERQHPRKISLRTNLHQLKKYPWSLLHLQSFRKYVGEKHRPSKTFSNDLQRSSSAFHASRRNISSLQGSPVFIKLYAQVITEWRILLRVKLIMPHWQRVQVQCSWCNVRAGICDFSLKMRTSQKQNAHLRH